MLYNYDSIVVLKLKPKAKQLPPPTITYFSLFIEPVLELLQQQGIPHKLVRRLSAASVLITCAITMQTDKYGVHSAAA